jgi:hypothetical protein
LFPCLAFLVHRKISVLILPMRIHDSTKHQV